MRRKPLKICAVTSTRADWGLLLPVLKAVQKDRDFDLKIIATGQHLVVGAGDTRRAIKADGFKIDALVDMKLVGDTPAQLTRSLGVGIAGVGDALAKIKPDLVFVLGDRYEILGATMAATLARVPVIHGWGGDITEGAIDDAIRHAITKLSHVHFVTNAAAQRRLCQMGENPAHVAVVGSSGIELLRTIALLGRNAFFESVKLDSRRKTIVVTFHPETLSAKTQDHCREMLAALDRLDSKIQILCCGTNADVQGRAIERLVKTFVASHTNAVFYSSLGSQRYLSALKHCDVVIGNSSSGIYEAPSFKTPTVNIGDRQKGRLRAESVIDVVPTRAAIYEAICKAFEMDCRAVKNPYGDGHASTRTLKALRKILATVKWDAASLLRKTFYTWPNH